MQEKLQQGGTGSSGENRGFHSGSCGRCGGTGSIKCNWSSMRLLYLNLPRPVCLQQTHIYCSFLSMVNSRFQITALL